MTKAGARPGDVLILTKPLGTGCITTAAKRDLAQAEHVAEAVEWMMRLNRAAAEAAAEAGAACTTDVTGFGLLGHASEVAEASGVTLRLSFAQIPLLAGATGAAAAWIFPGGSVANAGTFGPGVRFAERWPRSSACCCSTRRPAAGCWSRWRQVAAGGDGRAMRPVASWAARARGRHGHHRRSVRRALAHPASTLAAELLHQVVCAPFQYTCPQARHW